jgi:hypothetical protein
MEDPPWTLNSKIRLAANSFKPIPYPDFTTKMVFRLLKVLNIRLTFPIRMMDNLIKIAAK